MKDTSEQILRHPGRFLPFFAANPLRDSWQEFMDDALDNLGFVGVKLYPSLGYKIDDPETLAIVNRCHEKEVPILQHCSAGGFYAEDSFRDHSHPRHWKKILKDNPGLKVCFGHFGGDKSFLEKKIDPGSWTGQILEIMREPENTGVYADIAFHNDQMIGGTEEKYYFRNLEKLLEDPVVGERILFGTDFWMVRTAVREKNYWKYFAERLEKDGLFQKITLDNPSRFLGIGRTPGQSRTNIERHIEFLVKNLDKIDMNSAARWARDELRHLGLEGFSAERNLSPVMWNSNNEAHVRVYRYLRENQMYPDDAGLARFAACAFFPVTSLQFWNKGFESISIFKKKCETVARAMDRYFRGNGAEYEKNRGQTEAIRKMAASLADDGTVFADLGRVADHLYTFLKEETDSE